MCTTDESHKIRAFLENWSAKDEEKSDECSDSVEKVVRRNTSFVFTVNYKLKREDIESEVFDWLYCYLEERKCPYALAVALASAVSQSMADEYNSQKDTLLNGGTTHDLSGDELYRESINKVNELCDGYKQDAEEAIKLSAKHSVKPFVVSVCAIKNARRKMEDRHVIIHDMNSLFGIKSNKQYSYYGVFDGHAGIQAATYTASHLHRNLIKSQAFKDGDVKVAIKQAFSETDLHYLERSAREGILSGSTAVCCLFEGRNKLYLAWLGDSQAVLVKNGKPYDIMNPHKPERDDERHRIEEMGGLVSCIDTWRVNGTLAVSRAIGDPEHKPYVSSDPDVEEITLDGSEDYIIMACDGLWDQVTPEEATTIVYQHLAENCESDLNEVAENISEILTDNAKKEGSTDNITVIVLFLRDIQSILSTPFTPPSPKERSLVNNLLDFNENSSLGNPFANGGDINYNSNENEKNLLNSTNHVEAPTPPVDTVLSQNNLNFNYAPFGLNSQLKEDQKSPNPFAEWESTNKPQENVEIRDNSFITSNIAVNEVNQEETERASQWLDQNSNNPFDSNFQETDVAMPDISKEDDSQANAIPSLSDKIDQQFLDFSESKVGRENKELLEEDVSSSKILKAEPTDEPDLCSGKNDDNLSFTISPVPEIENKESNLVDFGSGLVCNIENENQNETSVSKETIEETLKFDEKVEDVPVIKSDFEFSNIENVPLNNDENNFPIENGEPFGEQRTSDVLNYEKTIEDLSEKTLYLSATDVQSEEKLPAEIIPVESQVKDIPQISSEVIEVQQVINEIPELINCSESSLKSDVTVVVQEPLLVETAESKCSELISEADKVVEPEKEKKETVEENVCLTVETNLVHTDDASDADTEKDLEWKFMAVSEPTAVTPVETVKTVEAKVASASKAITKTNTRATTAKTKPLSSQVTTATKSVSPVKTTKQGTKTAVATTASAASSKRPATATATSRTSSTRLSAKPDVTSTTSSTTTTSTATIGNKKVMLTKTTTTRTITKVATANSTSASTKPATKTAVASKTVAGKPNGVKAAPLSSVAEKRLSATMKTVPATKTTTSSTPVSKTLAASKPAGTRTASQPSKPTVESKVLKKTPTAPSATKALSDPKTRLSTVAQKRTASAPLGTSKASTNASAAGTKATNLKASPTKTFSRVNTGRIAPKTGSTVKNTTKTDIKPVPKAEINSGSVAEAKEENKESAAVIEEKSI